MLVAVFLKSVPASADTFTQVTVFAEQGSTQLYYPWSIPGTGFEKFELKGGSVEIVTLVDDFYIKGAFSAQSGYGPSYGNIEGQYVAENEFKVDVGYTTFSMSSGIAALLPYASLGHRAQVSTTHACCYFGNGTNWDTQARYDDPYVGLGVRVDLMPIGIDQLSIDLFTGKTIGANVSGRDTLISTSYSHQLASSLLGKASITNAFKLSQSLTLKVKYELDALEGSYIDVPAQHTGNDIKRLMSIGLSYTF